MFAMRLPFQLEVIITSINNSVSYLLSIFYFLMSRWDITKHIKLKAARDPAHMQARVLLLDASGERHYDQYDRYLVMMRVTESGNDHFLFVSNDYHSSLDFLVFFLGKEVHR